MLLIPTLTFDDEIRFWSKVDRKINADNSLDYSDCWLWCSNCDDNIRPRFSIGASNFFSSRVSYYLHNKQDPGELQVLHNCKPKPDNILCVNPKHLYLGTNQENSLDYCEKKIKTPDLFSELHKAVKACGKEKLLKKPNLIPALSHNDVVRLLSYIDRKSNSECWLWNGNTKVVTPGFRLKNKTYHASRVVYFYFQGTDPENLCVCHDCYPNKDNPYCMNPNHMFLGTQQENMQDCYDKGNFVINVETKITDEEVKELRRLYNCSEFHSVMKLSKIFNFSTSQIWKIVTYRTRLDVI